MTTQQAYERIRAYFTQPGAQLARVPAADELDPADCVYRKRKGNRILKCSVGCLIPKNMYDPSMEGLAAVQLFDGRYPGLSEHFSGVNKDFLSMAQSAHDDAKSVEDFIQELDRLARSHRLEAGVNA